MSNVPLPEPELFYWKPSFVKGESIQIKGYTEEAMHSHAAAVSAAKDAEIAGLRAELIKSLADNAALRADAIDRQNNVVAPLRERVRVLEDARPEPDCRTCAHFDCLSLGCHANRCDGVNMYEPLPPVRLWRTTWRSIHFLPKLRD